MKNLGPGERGPFKLLKFRHNFAQSGMKNTVIQFQTISWGLEARGPVILQPTWLRSTLAKWLIYLVNV